MAHVYVFVNHPCLSSFAAVIFRADTQRIGGSQLVSLSPQLHVLLANMHHAITDGWSAALMQRELTEAYAAVVNGQAPAWAPLPIQVPPV